MKRFSVGFSAFVLLLGLSGAAGAYSINYENLPAGNEFTSPYFALPGFVTEDFSGGTVGTLTGTTWAWSGDGKIASGSTYGLNAAPAGVGGVPDASNYITVPLDLASLNTITADLGGTYNYFGLWWGSVDTYNTLSFYKNGSLVESVTGSEAVAPWIANGNQVSSNTNLYVNFLNLPYFDTIKLTSTQFAFEADNMSVATPEPGTMLLLGSGLVGLAGWGRKKFRK